MTDPDERIINRALCELDWSRKTPSGKLQDIREEARAALHRLFRDRRRLENRVQELEATVQRKSDLYDELWADDLAKRNRIRKLEAALREMKAENERLREENNRRRWTARTAWRTG